MSDENKGFSLEDILAEFSNEAGGSSGENPPEETQPPQAPVTKAEKTPEPTPEAPVETAPEEEPPEEEAPEELAGIIDVDDGIYAPVDQLPQLYEQEQESTELGKLLSMEVALDESEGDVTGDPFEPLPEDKSKKVWTWEGETVEPLPDGGVELDVSKKAKRAAKARNKNALDADVTEQDSLPLPAALKKYSKAVKRIWPRLLPSFILCLIPVYITISEAFNLPLPIDLSASTLRWILAGFNLVVLLFCLEVPIAGVQGLIKLRPGIETGITVATVITLLQAIICDPNQGLPYCAVTTLGLFFAQWGGYFGKSAVRRSLRLAATKEKLYSVVRQEEGYEGQPAYFKTEGETEGFVAMAESKDCAGAAMVYYVPILILASLVFAFLCYYLKQADFLRTLAACLCAGLPMGGALCYFFPYAILAKRLASIGSALGGWTGAKALSGSGWIIITDNDLFPKSKLRIEGLKIFGSFSVERVVGYTTALIVASGSCLTDVFQKTLESEKTPMPFIDVFQTYEGGGLGAEINGDLVLVGSSNFMTLMGVKIAQGSKVRNGVYVAINGEIAGLFAVNYSPARSVSYTLSSMLRAKKLGIVMATRDFNITPTMMRHSFEINCDNIELPTIEQRVELSDNDAPRPGKRAAIVCREGLPPFGDVVVGARALRRTTITNTVLSLIGGAIGLVLMFYLAFMGASSVSVAGYVLIYTLTWALPVLLLSRWAGKY